MNVFISWSGDRSKVLATALSEFLRGVAPGVEPWLSQDIPAGSRWGDELNKKLDSTSFGVLCVTPENIGAPWLIFEAGALAKGVSVSRVVPYCLGFEFTEIPLPLSQFQGVSADEAGTRKLVDSLREGLQIPEPDGAFARYWASLRSAIERIVVSTGPAGLPPSTREIEEQRQAVSRFWNRVAGVWWERIPAHGIGIFQIRPDRVHNSVRMEEGRFFDKKGALAAYWNSAVARVDVAEKKIVYLRQCWHPSKPRESWFHGFGEMQFDGSADIFGEGFGKFCDVNRTHPENTQVHAVQLHRAGEENEIRIMASDNLEDRRSLVRLRLKSW